MNERVTIDLRKVEPAEYYIKLRFRELWRAWRHGINLPKDRVQPRRVVSFNAGSDSGGGSHYAGEWTVPEGVTGVDIEVLGGGGGRG